MPFTDTSAPKYAGQAFQPTVHHSTPGTCRCRSPTPRTAKVKASADIVRSAASFIVLPFDGGSDVVAALPVEEWRTSRHPLDPCHGLPIGVLAPVEEAGNCTERDEDQEKVLPRYAADHGEQRSATADDRWRKLHAGAADPFQSSRRTYPAPRAWTRGCSRSPCPLRQRERPER